MRGTFMNKKHLLVLTAFSILIYFVGNENLIVTDPTESNYAETAREMLAAGDFVSPRIYGHYWFDKPIMYYLELIISFKLFGMNNFAVRFFPALMASATLFLTYAFGARYLGAKRALVAALILGTTVAYYYIGHAAITDTTMVFFAAAAIMSFYRRYTGGSLIYQYFAFFSLAMAALTKGPIGICLPGLIILLFLAVRRELKFLLSFHILLGFLLTFAVASLWYVPMFLIHGWYFIDTFFGVHNLLRATVAEHPRFDVWYYYFIIFIVGFLPWSLLLIVRYLKNALGERKLFLSLPREPLTQLLVIWAATVFIVFTLIATKYVTYTFPYMLPLSLLFSKYFKLDNAFKISVSLIAAAFLVTTLFIAPRYTYEFSGLTLRDTLYKAQLLDNTCLYTYHTNAPVSFMYYTGKKIARAEKPEDIKKLTPDGVSWTALNIMPLVDINELNPDENSVIIAPKNEQNLCSDFEKVSENGEFAIFVRRK